MILIEDLLMVNHTVVIASVAACLTLPSLAGITLPESLPTFYINICKFFVFSCMQFTYKCAHIDLCLHFTLFSLHPYGYVQFKYL